ncbi:MAG: Na+/H+ antiporter NhaC family protein, partial [Selenomonas sp.]|nr:Na+/H+ antiporter NhaC family protein [Selenomonas sp.]
ILVVSVAAILSGAVCGDHASPISDTTILASAGAQCHHLDHVSTQLPYVAVVASCSLIGYIADGLTENGYIGLAVGIVSLAVFMVALSSRVTSAEQ